TRYEPVLDDDAAPHIAVSVDGWWEMLVYASSAEAGARMPIPPPEPTRLLRRDIVLAAANKDGGTHVDAKLTPEYERLISPDALAMYGGDIHLVDGRTVRPIPNTDTHLVYLRQMGYEMLESPALRSLLSIYN
nr:hypothetical protein [Rubrobacter sp.]